MEKPQASSILIFIIIFSPTNADFVACSLSKNVTLGRCIDGEMNALLRFKTSLYGPSDRLRSWNTRINEDCCTWRGVACSKRSGHVVKLDIGWQHFDDPQLEGFVLDQSLSELKYLSYLDLSGCNFEQSPMPLFLNSMKRLHHLNLSYTGFSGVVPHQLGNLSSLQVLDLKDNRGGTTSVDDLTWIPHLSSLEYLDLSYVDLSLVKDVVKVFSMLPFLTDLRMYACGLDDTQLISHYGGKGVNSTTALGNVRFLDLGGNLLGGQLPHFLYNMTSLKSLLLSYNNYNLSTPGDISRLRNLTHLALDFNSLLQKADWISDVIQKNCHLKALDLSSNQFYGEFSSNIFSSKNFSSHCKNNMEELILAGNDLSGHLPDKELIGNLNHLKYLDLSMNEFDGPISFSLGYLSALNKLDLSNNKLSGPIPSSLGKLSALVKLDLSKNNLSVPIPSSLGNISALEELVLSNNALSGPIPSSLGNLIALRELFLQHNQLIGDIPVSLGQLSNLESIDMSSNSQLHGTLSESQLNNLSKLESLETSHTLLKICVSFDWVPPFQLKRLAMRSCEIVDHKFPEWIQTQEQLSELDLSNCNISGALPEWLQHMTNLTDFSVSQNNLIGTIPKFPSNILFLSLSQNFFTGTIPRSICNLNDLMILDLSRNSLSGNLPSCLEKLQSLSALRLSSNHLSGVIPIALGRVRSLRFLHLDNNSFTGKIPSTLRHCTNLQVLDVGDNNLFGKLPRWIGTYLLHLKVLRLRNNHISGTISSEFCQLLKLQIMNLASNELTGEILPCFGNLSAMIKFQRGFSFQWKDERLTEGFKGLELEYTTTSRFVVNLDLSNNNLAGIIPLELTNLFGLIGLNLSHNHLTGVIPERIGDMKSLESLDFSSNNLFGTIPDSLSSLTSLSHLNLSYNNLSGPIPTGNQLQTLNVDPSIYDGNIFLCGPPLVKKCHDEKRKGAENHAAIDNGNKIDKIWLSASVIIGFATGFWGFIGVLVFKRNWRQAVFQFAESRLSKFVWCS